MNALWSVPETWQWSNMGSISEVVGGGTPDTRNLDYFGGDVPWLTPADLSGYRGKRIDRGARNLSRAGLNNSGARLMPAGSVLFTSRAPIGYVVIAANAVCTNQGFKSFIPRDGVLPDYIYYFLQYAKPIAMQLASGTTFLEISGKKAAQIPIPIAPTREQHRIADKLDELFSDLDAGVEALKRVREKLKLYRASVLKAAVEGKLTEEWRKQNSDVEPASELLKRILAERRKRWEEDQLCKFEAAGKKPPKDWKSKYKEPVAPDFSKLPELPRGWCWATLDEVTCESLIGLDRGMDHQRPAPPGLPYVKMNNVTMDGEVLTRELVYITATDEELDRYRLRQGDLLFNTRNSLELVGKTGLVRQVPADAVYNNNLMRLRFDGAVLSAFACLQLCGIDFRARMERVKRATTSVAAVYAKDLFPLPIALPPIQEQRLICEIVEGQFSIVEHVEHDLERRLKSTSALRQSTLSMAFSGRLVAQDPHDEPAEKLLRRITTALRSANPGIETRSTGARRKIERAKKSKAVR